MNIIDTRNPELMATLAKHMQDTHLSLYPTFFKPYDQLAIRNYFEDIFQKPNEFIYLWQDKNEAIAAYLWLAIEDVPENPFRYGYHRLYIRHVAVMPDYQGKGLSKELLLFADNFAKKNDIHVVELHYWYDNTIAKLAYEKFGYVPYQEIAQKRLV